MSRKASGAVVLPRASKGAVAGTDESEPVRQALIGFRAIGEQQLRERFERAKAEGDLPASSRPDALAAFVCAHSSRHYFMCGNFTAPRYRRRGTHFCGAGSTTLAGWRACAVRRAAIP